MRVRVDPELCKGHGQCEDACPEVFRVEDDALAHVLVEEPGEELREKVEDARRRCPEQAISVEET